MNHVYMRPWAHASGRVVLLSSLVLCALRPFAWCGDGAAPGASDEEEGIVQIISPAGAGEQIIACTDAGGRVRIPILFRMSSAPGQILSFEKLNLIVLLDGDEHSMVTVSDDAMLLERLQTRSTVEWPHDVMVAQGQCYSVSVLLDLPERTSLISASVNFCVGRGPGDSSACAAAAAAATATTSASAEEGGGAAEPGAGSERRYGHGKGSGEGKEGGEGAGSFGAGERGGRLAPAPYIALPRAASNVCVGHINVQVFGLSAAQALLLPIDASPPHALQATLRFDGHLVSTDLRDIMRTGAEARQLGAEDGADLHGVHTLQLDLIQTAALGDDAGVPIPLYTHTVGFHVSNDLTCLTLQDQQRHLAADASSPHAHRVRARVAGAMRRQQDLFLASLFVFPGLPQGGFFTANSPHDAGTRDENGARGTGKADADAVGHGHAVHCSFTGLCHKIYMRHLRMRAAEEAEAEAAADRQGVAPAPQGPGVSVESARATASEHGHRASARQTEAPNGEGGECSWSGCSWDRRVRQLREGPLSRNTLAPPVALHTGPSTLHPKPQGVNPDPRTSNPRSLDPKGST